MKIKLLSIFLLTLSLGLGIQACHSGQDKGKEAPLPGDVINNPATAGKNANPGQMPVMTFTREEHDFGRLIQGETVSYGFSFKNTGGSDLVIASVSTSCGCTVTDYPKNPVAPGKEGVVTVTFKTEGKRGFQHKTVTVMANTQPNTKVLKISAEIRLPEDEK